MVAVSGGVDSVVLLDVLSRQTRLELIVAHFDHGIRKDSEEDRKFVEILAKKYSLPFVYAEGKLGEKTSEAVARKARYDFLYAAQKQHGAMGIITAHHQDDLLETAILNLLRGTYRRGLSSLRSTASIKRPLLNLPKADLIKYAEDYKLSWHEDSTNNDETYLRNYIRLQIVPRFTSADRRLFLNILGDSKNINEAADHIITRMLEAQTKTSLDKQWFRRLPHVVSRDVMAAWLSRQSILGVDRRSLEELVVAAKTLPVGKQRDINAEWILKIGKTKLALTARER